MFYWVSEQSLRVIDVACGDDVAQRGGHDAWVNGVASDRTANEAPWCRPASRPALP